MQCDRKIGARLPHELLPWQKEMRVMAHLLRLFQQTDERWKCDGDFHQRALIDVVPRGDNA